MLEQTLQLAHDKNDKLAKLVQQKTIQVDSQAAAQDASSSTVFNQVVSCSSRGLSLVFTERNAFKTASLVCRVFLLL